MINLFMSNGNVCVWNAEDVKTLRKEYRIVGCLIGNYPCRSFQIETKWLPLKLLPEEARLLTDLGFAQLFSVPEHLPDPITIMWFFDRRDKLCEDQMKLLKENRKLQILEKADEILEGKKRKLEALEKKKKAQKLSEIPLVTAAETSSIQNTDAESKSCHRENSSNSAGFKESMESELIGDSAVGGDKNLSVSESQECSSESVNVDKNSIIDSELAKKTNLSKESCLIQFFTENPWKTKFDPVTWKYPSSEIEKLRYSVYKDLWGKNYYITSGAKFGGDFLAYEGDPLKYHALFIVICMRQGQKFQGYDIVTYGRMGHQVKKTVAFASVNDRGEVEYISLSWENETA